MLRCPRIHIRRIAVLETRTTIIELQLALLLPLSVELRRISLELHGQIVTSIPLEGVAPPVRHIVRVVGQQVLLVCGNVQVGLVVVRWAGSSQILGGGTGKVAGLVELVGLVEVDWLVEVEGGVLR